MFTLIRKDLGYGRKELVKLFEVKKARDSCKWPGPLDRWAWSKR